MKRASMAELTLAKQVKRIDMDIEDNMNAREHLNVQLSAYQRQRQRLLDEILRLEESRHKASLQRTKGEK